MSVERSAIARTPSLVKREIAIPLITGFLIYSTVHTSVSALPLYVLALGGTAFDAGWHAGLFAATAIALRFFFGPWADRKGRKGPLLIGSFAFGTAPLLFIVTDSMIGLGAARMYQAIGMAAYLSNANTFLADQAPPGRRGLVLSANRAAIILALLVGPACGIVAAQAGAFPLLFGAMSAAGLLACALLTLLPDDRPAGERAERGSLFPLLRIPELRSALGTSLLTALAFAGLTSFFGVYAGEIGLPHPERFFPIFGASGLAIALVAGGVADRYGRFAVLAPSLFSFGIGLGLLGLRPYGGGAAVAAALSGIGYTGAMTAVVAWTAETVGPERRARALALQESAMDSGIGFGSLLLGALSIATGFGPLYVAVGAGCWVAALHFCRRLSGCDATPTDGRSPGSSSPHEAGGG